MHNVSVLCFACVLGVCPLLLPSALSVISIARTPKKTHTNCHKHVCFQKLEFDSLCSVLSPFHSCTLYLKIKKKKNFQEVSSPDGFL